MEDPTPPKRRWWRRLPVRLSLRALMVLVLILGGWLGWIVNRVRNQRSAVAAIREYGGFIHYDHEFVGGKVTAGTEPRAPRWLRRWLGDDHFQDVTSVSLVYDDSTGPRYETTRTTDDVLANLRFLPRVEKLYLQKTQATDASMEYVGQLTRLDELMMWDAAIGDRGVSRLRGLKRLKNIHVSNSGMTDQGLRTLSQLPDLETLSLQGHHFTDAGLSFLGRMKNVKGLYVGLKSEITDEGLAHIRHFGKLRKLDLQGSKVTDRGLQQLRDLPSLKEVWTSGSQVTPAGIEKLKAEIPGLVVR